MILITPFGIPAFSASSTNLYAVIGVCVAGFRTTVQAVARAGAILRVVIAAGKFQGVIAATTPTGCFCSKIRLFGCDAGIVFALTRLGYSAYQSSHWLA